MSALSTASQPSFKRKSKPHRSIPFNAALTADEKMKLGIVQLDVYRLFRADPQVLLTPKQALYTSPPLLPTDQGKGSLSPVPSLTSSSPRPYAPSTPRSSQKQRKPKGSGTPTRTSSSSAPASTASTYQSSLVYDAQGRPMVTWPKSPLVFLIVNRVTHVSLGDPLYISPHSEGYDALSEEERQVCAILRIPPVQYLKVKETLLAHRHYKGFFRKREAQKLVRIDVNKTGKLYDWFVALGWLLAPESA